MNVSEIRGYIEAIETDYEDNISVHGLELFNRNGVLARKISGSSNIHANKVVKYRREAISEEIIDQIFEFFDQSPFSFDVLSSSGDDFLIQMLERRGMSIRGEYSGLALDLRNEVRLPDESRISIVDVNNKELVETLMNLVCRIWDIHDQKSKELMLKEREDYTILPGRRGGFLVALYEGEPAGYANYRISSDHRVQYLTGAGVLEKYRNMGIYQLLLKRRLKYARENGCELAVVRARRGHSDHILTKLGFIEYSNYVFLVRD